MDGSIFEGGKPTMCLDKYLRHVSIQGMVEKIQIRQLIATRHVDTDHHAMARCHTLAIFCISTVSGMGLDLSQVHSARSADSDADKDGSAWAKGQRSDLGKRDTESCITRSLNPRPMYQCRD